MSQSQEPGHDSHEHPHQQLEHPHQQQLEHPHQQLEHPHQQLEHPHQQLQHQPLQQLQQAAVAPLQSSDNQFACQWSGCNERAANAETLYDHVCESHIGRKSTNNLNLTCAWGSCRVTVVKRDHITSHIRVHVPLKPHRCEFCGKSFKRPQDLKKHVKTHADDSVLVPTGPNGVNRGQPNAQQNGYNPHQQPKPQDYFPGQQPLHSSMPMSYPQHQPHNGQGYYGPPPSSQAPAYGSVSYAVNYGGEVGNQASMQSQKQGLEAIRNLVLDGRNQAYDTGSYNQISNRLASIGSNSLPFLGGMGEYQSGGSPGGGVYGPTAQYSLPAIPHLRTKDDLINADQVFAALQTTIYENPNAIAAAGVGQPGAQYVQSMDQRNSHSPRGMNLPSAHNANYMPSVGIHSPQSNNSGTPALTPPSSAHSYTSGGSPHSLHGNNSYGPAPPAAMYPTLPGPSSEAANDYTSSSMAPASALGSQFDDGHRRRYSGGRLHKAQPLHSEPTTEDAMDTSEDGAKTPKQTNFHSPSPKIKATNNPKSRDQKLDFSSSNLDPALGGTISPASGEIGEAAIKENEKWVNNCRTVESIRAWLKQRLESNDYESDADREGKQPEVKEESSSLYPVLGQREGDE